QGAAVMKPVGDHLRHVPQGLHRRPLVLAGRRAEPRGHARLSQEAGHLFVDVLETPGLRFAGTLSCVRHHPDLPGQLSSGALTDRLARRPILVTPYYRPNGNVSKPRNRRRSPLDTVKFFLVQHADLYAGDGGTPSYFDRTLDGLSEADQRARPAP